MPPTSAIESRFTCAATGATVRQPVQTDHGINYDDDTDDAIPFPDGWGDVVIRIRVQNPELPAVLASRAAEQATLDAMLADPDVPAERKGADMIARFAAGLDAAHPLPEPVWKVLTWSPLSPGALAAAVKAMEAAGFPALTE